MAFEIAARVSALGQASLTRFLHINGASYCVYAAKTLTNSYQFYYRPIPAVPDYNEQPVPGTEVAIGQPIALVNSFYVIESNDNPGQALFLYDDGSFVWRFIYDFTTSVLVEQPVQLFAGANPIMVSAIGDIISLYLRESNVQSRTDFGPESTVVRPSGKEIESFAARPRTGVVIQYAGAHDLSPDTATLLRTDANTDLLYVIDNPIITDLSGNGRDGYYTSPTFFSGYGVCFKEDSAPLTCGAFPFASAITTETWFVPTGSTRIISVYGGPISLTITDNEFWTFSFGSTTYRARLPLPTGRRNHVVVSHTFGSGAATFISLNGRQIPGSWFAGTGNETPSLSGGLTVKLGSGDLFQEFKVSRVAKTISAIKSYMAGLS